MNDIYRSEKTELWIVKYAGDVATGTLDTWQLWTAAQLKNAEGDQRILETHKIKDLAHAAQMEWIVDNDGDVCLRPMLFNEDGSRVVRYHPDPYEFRPESEAIARLIEICRAGGIEEVR